MKTIAPCTALALGLLALGAAARADAGALGGLSIRVPPPAQGAQAAAQRPALAPVCGADHGQLAPVQLRGREQLVYKLDVFGAEIGTFELRLGTAPALERSRAPLLVEARGKTSDLVTSNLRRVEGWSSALLDESGRAVRYREEVDEGNVHRAQDVDFPAQGGNLAVRATRNGDPDPVALQATPEARDLLSGLFVLRHQPMQPGEKLCAEIYAARRMWRVEGAFAAKAERIDTPLGKLDTLRLDAVATRLDDPRVVRKAHVWLTTDARRLPVVILGDIRGRFVRAQLAEAKLGRSRIGRRTASAP